MRRFGCLRDWRLKRFLPLQIRTDCNFDFAAYFCNQHLWADAAHWRKRHVFHFRNMPLFFICFLKTDYNPLFSCNVFFKMERSWHFLAYIFSNSCFFRIVLSYCSWIFSGITFPCLLYSFLSSSKIF